MTTKLQFDHEVEATHASAAIKSAAIAVQDKIWADDGIPATVHENENGSLTFTETGTVLKASVTIGDAPTHLPHPRIHSDMELLGAIHTAQNNYIGDGAYSQVHAIYGSDLNLGATVASHSLHGVTVDVFGPNLALALTETPA